MLDVTPGPALRVWRTSIVERVLSAGFALALLGMTGMSLLGDEAIASHGPWMTSLVIHYEAEGLWVRLLAPSGALLYLAATIRARIELHPRHLMLVGPLRKRVLPLAVIVIVTPGRLGLTFVRREGRDVRGPYGVGVRTWTSDLFDRGRTAAMLDDIWVAVERER